MDSDSLIPADSLPVSGYEVLQLQQTVFTVFHHFLCVQMLHQARQDPANTNIRCVLKQKFTLLSTNVKEKTMFLHNKLPK